MKRLLILALLLGSLALPGTVLGFHHGGLPSTLCSADVAGEPSDTNGKVRFGLSHNTAQTIPLPPVGVPGQGPTEDQGGANCANGPDD
ncbi:MAG: hypothetical protein WD402_04110 [Chloroflexota bacterium]